MVNPDTPTQKAALRNAMRERLRELKGDSNALCEAIDRWLSAHPEAHTVAAFAALPGEPDLFPLISRSPDRRWVLPRVDGESLTFHAIVDPETELARGTFGILEPSAVSMIVPLLEIDAFLCPGLAFDRNGNRLGRGRGYYDRMLEKIRGDARKLGVCFPFQIVTNTFPEPHDILMEELITPSPAP